MKNSLLKYQYFVKEIDKTKESKDVVKLLHYISGLSSEVGEVSQLFQKSLYKSPKEHVIYIDEIKLSNELGDVLWYLTAIANFFNIKLSDIIEINENKLKERHNK